jgi:hypothetical protein
MPEVSFSLSHGYTWGFHWSILKKMVTFFWVCVKYEQNINPLASNWKGGGTFRTLGFQVYSLCYHSAVWPSHGSAPWRMEMLVLPCP